MHPFPSYPSMPAKQYIKIHVQIIGPPIKSKASTARNIVEKLMIKSLMNIVEIQPKDWIKANKNNMMVPTITLMINPSEPKTNMNNKTHGKSNRPIITKVTTSGMKFHTS